MKVIKERAIRWAMSVATISLLLGVLTSFNMAQASPAAPVDDAGDWLPTNSAAPLHRHRRDVVLNRDWDWEGHLPAAWFYPHAAEQRMRAKRILRTLYGPLITSSKHDHNGNDGEGDKRVLTTLG